MGIEKAELKAGVIHDLGVKFEDILEASKAAIHRAEGADQALQQAAQVIQQLHVNVDKEVEANQLTLEQASLAKRWITRACTVTHQLAQNASLTQTAQRGHAQGVAYCVEFLKGQYEAAANGANLARQQEAAREQEGQSIKAERLAEAAAESVPPAAPEPGPEPESVATPDVTRTNGARPRRRSIRAAQNGPNAG